ncbi:Anthranilate 1,2-dioxygenase large subunit [Pigmentiphaga humi]|uniref:Anthranilate 1,2-dioxygenase large subunit n=1 Tax=Pigmentiphaga humi TaxID=2478468 RepID=A0A3P4B892_9BURK|nr:SRPBCC family protein [Pigmentiphaga humi]VCU71850.1 Anthranilate 1,2-dioxygenase large subunit [Pigmentiphaga humi]
MSMNPRGDAPSDARAPLTGADLDRLLDDRAEQGIFRVHRDAFTDPAVFEHEQASVFESTWVFVGLDSQLPRAHDFLTTRIGRQPVLVTRDGEGRLHCLLNSCRHRGMMVATQRSGNRRTHTCRYHGWVYGSDGANQYVSNQAEGRYPGWFQASDHGLAPVARFGSYRGFLFASLSEDVPPLDEYLGDARAFLDLIVDQGPQGLEFVPGNAGYTFQANWKLQLENSLDMYHFSSTHASYVELLARRETDAFAGGMPPAQAEVQGTFSFGHGHAVTWRESRASAALLARRRAACAAAMDDTRVRWALRARNLTIFPNLQIVDNVTSVMLRVIHPLAADQTEMRTHCLAPKGEEADLRAARIRDYEDFFNASGLATPDDNVAYEHSQAGFAARAAGWTAGYLRGLDTSGMQSIDPYAAELGMRHIDGRLGPRTLGDETCFHDGYRAWHRLMRRGLNR